MACYLDIFFQIFIEGGYWELQFSTSECDSTAVLKA